MAVKKTFSATFANGDTITRNSERTYTHAYRVTCSPVIDGEPRLLVDTGFAASAQLADKAARAAYGVHFYSDKFRQGSSQARAHIAAKKTAAPILSLEVVPVEVK